MSVTTIPQSGLVWSQTKHWSLACRCSFKSWAEQVFTFLQWLGPYIETHENPNNQRPRFVGYILDEQDPRPDLLWAEDRSLSMESLNG